MLDTLDPDAQALMDELDHSQESQEKMDREKESVEASLLLSEWPPRDEQEGFDPFAKGSAREIRRIRNQTKGRRRTHSPTTDLKG